MSGHLHIEPLRDFVRLTNEKRQLEAQLKRITDQLKVVEDQAKSALVELGDDEHPGSMTIDGMNLHLRRELWARAKDGDREATAHALKETGLGYLVKEDFNVQSLSAWVREVKGKGDEASLEEQTQFNAILPYLDLAEGYRVGARSAS